MKNKERDILRKEIEQLMDSKIGYAEINRLDESVLPENKFSAEDGWQEFKRVYLPKLFDCKNKKSHERIKKSFTAVAVALTAILSINIISVMAGIDIIDTFTRWTSEIFNLNSDENSVVNEDSITDFESISKLEKHINENIPVPKYMPQGYELNSVELAESGRRSS